MNHKLLWKFLLIIASGTVALFYVIDYFAKQTEAGMSVLEQQYRDEITAWGREAEKRFNANDQAALDQWLNALKAQEGVDASVLQYATQHIAGSTLDEAYYTGNQFGRSVDWPIHLNFMQHPLMEVPFKKGQVSFLIFLPQRMMPGRNLPIVRLTLQIFIPFLIMTLLSVLLYRHIMQPLQKLELATSAFSQGDLSARAVNLMGQRNDELSALATTFDQMACRIGEQIVNQRQLIADLSHELRTPLTRLDMAINQANNAVSVEKNMGRVIAESANIRRLVEDTLALAWLENEQPVLQLEEIDLVDLMDVIVADAAFEFPDTKIAASLPDSALLKQSNHFVVGQALENIVRNAMRYTPADECVTLTLETANNDYVIKVDDSGPGVPETMLEKIFAPFFRIEQSREDKGNSFGLGLSLARRQLTAVGGSVYAVNRLPQGLSMVVTLPKIFDPKSKNTSKMLVA